MLILGTLTSGHARAILSLDDKELRIALSKRIIEDNLNVRQAEALAKQLQKKKPQKKDSILYAKRDADIASLFGCAPCCTRF